MQGYQTNLTVAADDLDELNHVNNVRYLQWVQDISKEHFQKRATPEMITSYIWVVLNHNISYKRAAVLGDEITLNTYIKSSTGAKSVRIVEMFLTKTKQLLVRCQTEWCMLDATTLRPTRISDELKNIFIESEN